MSRMNRLTILGLGAILTVGVGSWGMASAASQTTPPSYTGQVRAITIDQPALEPGARAGSLVLAQAGGSEVTLAIPAGTAIQRGDHHTHLEALSVGNYVTVQAVRLPSQTDDPLSFALDQPSPTGDRVGTTAGERPYTLRESSGP
jgi:hypothetical protein